MKINYCGICGTSTLSPLYDAPAGWSIKTCLDCTKRLHEVAREGWNKAVAERTGKIDPYAQDWGAEVKKMPGYVEGTWVIQ